MDSASAAVASHTARMAEMIDALRTAYRVLLQYGIEALRTDMSRLEFGQLAWAEVVAGACAASILISLVLRAWRRHVFTRAYSGHMAVEHYHMGIFGLLVRQVPRALWGLAVLFLLGALAEPFFFRVTEEVIRIPSRERVDLMDVSTSMEQQFKKSGKSKAQVAHEAFMQFLQMRQGKNDRTSLWAFSSNPHKIEDFVVDDELYFFQAHDMPWIMMGASIHNYDEFELRTKQSIFVPFERYRMVGSEGGTDLAKALAAITEYIDVEGKKEFKRKAVLIVTDAQTDSYPENELRALQQRNVVPYIIFVNEQDSAAPDKNAHAEKLLEQIGSFGGRYFDVSDERSLRRAYEAIDALETTLVEIKRRALTVPAHRSFLVIALVCALAATIVGACIEWFFGTKP